LLKRRNKDVVISRSIFTQNQLFIWGGEGRPFCSGKQNIKARLPGSLLARLFKGKCAVTEEMHREDVNVVEYSDMKSDLKSELAKTVSISTAKPKS
jgi:hypothetical protein